MGIDEVALFQTRGSGHCTLSMTHFTVVKTKNEEEMQFIFYAIAGEWNNITDLLPYDNSDEVDDLMKYERQVAYIVCTHGWIESLSVFHESLGVQSVDPRRCGIGTVLTELCLIDPEVNRGKVKGNQARALLEYFGGNEYDMSEKYCKKLVGLAMVANPPGGGRVYLTAASNMGYEILVVDSTDQIEDLSVGPSNTKRARYTNTLNIYQTAIAKIEYDPITGNIGPCCGKKHVCQAYNRNWFFCQLVIWDVDLGKVIKNV